MKRTTKLILTLLPLIALPCVISTGYAIFNLGSSASKLDNKVNIGIEDGGKVGTAQLMFKSLTDEGKDTEYVIESNNDSLTVVPITCLFCDTEEVYFVQNYRMYEERSFAIYFEKLENESLWNNYIVSLSCTMTFIDDDPREVDIHDNRVTDGSISNYPTSLSLLDIVEPSYIEFLDTTYDLGSDNITTSEGVTSKNYISKFSATTYNNGSIEDATYITYNATVCSDLSKIGDKDATNSLLSYPFKIKLDYKTYTDTDSSTSYSFRPSEYRSSKKDGVDSVRQRVTQGIYDALMNSKVDIYFTFHLTSKN